MFLKDVGIVIAAKDLGDADKVLITFGKNFGKLEILAKNIKKLASRRAPACQILSYSKFAVSKSRVLNLTEAVPFYRFSQIFKDLPKLVLALEAAEIVNLTTPVGVPSQDLFQAFVSFLKKLEKTTSRRQARIYLAAFLVKLLVKGGWLAPDFRVKNFSNFFQLEKFLIGKLEDIAGKKINSVEFAKLVWGTN